MRRAHPHEEEHNQQSTGSGRGGRGPLAKLGAILLNTTLYYTILYTAVEGPSQSWEVEPRCSFSHARQRSD